MVPPPIASSPKSAEESSWRRDLLLLVFGVALLLGPHLGRRALWSPDEGRYAEIPREMVATGDYLTPRLNGVKYFEKPPLGYWVAAGALAVFGPEEWAVRLGPALFALAGAIAVYAAGRSLFGRSAGRWSAAVLATSLLWFGLGETLTLDMLVTSLLTITLLFFLAAIRAEDPRRRYRFLLAFFATAALATLAKGLIGIVIPGMVIAIWIAAFQQWKWLRWTFDPKGIGLFLLIAAPWHVAVARANPEFAWFYFVHEHVLRFATTVHRRYEPAWFFVPILIAGLLPWTGFVPGAIRSAWRFEEKRTVAFLLIWPALVFAFFSLSDSKLVPYILPAVPPLAILVGREIARLAEKARGSRRWAPFAVLATLAGALGTGFLLLPEIPRAAAFAQLLGDASVWLAASLLLLALAPLVCALAGRFRLASGATVACAAVFLSTLAAAMPRLDASRSVKTLATTLRERLRPEDEVATYRDYFQDLPFYLGRTVTVAEWRGELEYGIESEPEKTGRWMISADEFARRWSGPGTVYVLADEKSEPPEVRATGRVIARSGANVLLVNRP